jgi:EAL and modified HD-GYP domain-containing signal transduction protein
MAQTSTATVAPPGHAFVARQPILDQTRKLVGYELLLKPASPSDPHASALDRTSARVISETLLSIGLETLTGGKPAFVNISRRLLLEGIPEVLPAKSVVLQLAGDVEADSEVVEACTTLRQAGYSFAVDEFVLNPWTADLVPLSSYLKVNASTIDAGTRAKLITERAPGGPALIATSVDTIGLFDALVGVGCPYFQGLFLGEPVVKRGRIVPGQQLTYLRLLRALNNPDLSVAALEELVKHDAALCHRILQTVNSAGFALRTTVRSIGDALLLLGRDTVRRWASLWALASLNERAHPEVVVMATIRARCCEILGGLIGGDDGASDGFFLGLCSLLDTILERRMSEVLVDLPLSDEIKHALLGADSTGRRLLDCVIAYERGKWDEAVSAGRRLGLDPLRLPKAYADALRWSKELHQHRAAPAA